MQELFKGLRWELIDCTGHAHSAPECGCGCPWPSDVASEAADLIKSQAAEIEKYKALHDQMGNALETLWLAAPTDVQCNNMHHPKPKQHRYNETCPMVGEYHEAITGAGKTLKAWRAMK